MARHNMQIGKLSTESYHQARELIKTRTLIGLLMGDATGDKPITDGQRKSIDLLLSKALPNLANTTSDPDLNYPLVEQDIPPPANTDKPDETADDFVDAKAAAAALRA